VQSKNKSVVKEQVAAGKRKAPAPLSNGAPKQQMTGGYSSSITSSSPQLVHNGMQYGSPGMNGMNGGPMVGSIYGNGSGNGLSAFAPMSQNPMRMHSNGAGPSTQQAQMQAQYDFNAPAAEFLGVPEISGTFTIKDVDAAYMADEFGQYAPVGVSEDVSSLLEVPDLDFGSFGMGQQQQQHHHHNQGWGDDSVVPDISYPH